MIASRRPLVHGRRRGRPSAGPRPVRHWTRDGFWRASPATAVYDAGHQGQKDQGAYGAGDTNDDTFVVLDPGFDVLALAVAVAAVAATTAGSAVEEVLVDAVARADLRGGADQFAGGTEGGTGVGVVAVEETAHHTAALVVPAGALATCAGESRATAAAAGAVLFERVGGTRAGVAAASLCNVAVAATGATYCPG